MRFEERSCLYNIKVQGKTAHADIEGLAKKINEGREIQMLLNVEAL